MNSKEFRLEREAVWSQETLLDCCCEQSVERDFVLPDYYPDIFRVLKCTLLPSVTSVSVSGGKLTIDSEALIRVLYVSENDKRINCIEQTAALSKTLEVKGEMNDPTVSALPSCDYVNCRVVNRRRLDIRGAVSTAVKVSCCKEEKVISDASGGGIQLKKQLSTYPAKMIAFSKRITMIEELELSPSKPSVGTVLRCGCSVTQGECRVIAGKLMTKGEADITFVYGCVSEAGEDTVETMRFSVPFSQMIDAPGIDESFTPELTIRVSSCTAAPKGDSASQLECEIVLSVEGTAVKLVTGELVRDAYSTLCECETEPSSCGCTARTVKLEGTARCEHTLRCTDEGVSSVYDCKAECKALSAGFDPDKNSFIISGTALFCALGADTSGEPFFAEGQASFEGELKAPEELKDRAGEMKLSPSAEVRSCSYYITDKGSLEMTAELNLSLSLRGEGEGQVLRDIKLYADKPKLRDRRFAVKLCRPGGEDIWEIAKRYSCSAAAIAEENELSEETDNNKMLLIPLTD